MSKLPTVFELNEAELESAKVVKKLKTLKNPDNEQIDSKTLLAALSILSTEMEKSDE